MEQNKGSILEQYMNQLKIDRENENDEFPEDSMLSENEREEYKNLLKELRDKTSEVEEQYLEKKREMQTVTEKQMCDNGSITDEEVSVRVRHAYCDACGEELISNCPPMFNPYTMEKICKHTCSKCGKVFNLEYAYPRTVFINVDGKEINAFGL